MNKIKLLFLGILPFIIGGFLNFLMIKYNWYGIKIWILSVIFFIYWFYVGYKSYDYVKKAKKSILIGNSFAIISIFLILFQALIIKSFMNNFLGILPQMFYLQAMPVVRIIESILFFFLPIHYVWLSLFLAFILMLLVYYTGYCYRIKNNV